MDIIAIVLVIVFFISLDKRLRKLEVALSKKGNIKKEEAVDLREENIVKTEYQSQENVGSIATKMTSEYANENIQRSEQVVVPPPPPPNISKEKADANINSADVLTHGQSSNDFWTVDYFFRWLAIDWPLKIGSFLLILGVGWFLTYAFIHDWIGNFGRIAIGIIFGLLSLVFGAYRIKKSSLQGNAFMLIGSIVILISIIAGSVLYNFFSASIVLFISLCVVGFLATMALLQKKINLGATTLLLGGIVPMFVASDIKIGLLFLYLFALSFGVLWLVSIIPWKELIALNVVVLYFYLLVYGANGGFAEVWQNTLWIFVFVALLCFANVVAVLKAHKVTKIDLAIVGITGLMALLWITIVIPNDLVHIIFLLAMLLFGMIAFAIYELTLFKDLVVAYLAVAVVFLLAATTAKLDTWTLMVAYAIEFGGVVLTALYFTQKENTFRKVVEISMIFYGILAWLSMVNIVNMIDFMSANVLTQNLGVGGDIVAVVFMSAVAFTVGLATNFWAKIRNYNYDNFIRKIEVYMLSAELYGLFLIWFFIHIFIENQAVASMLSLILFTLIGVVFYAMNKVSGKKMYYFISKSLFLVVLIRLFLVEFWMMNIAQKIVTFLVVGALFISTTFIGRNDNEQKSLETNE